MNNYYYPKRILSLTDQLQTYKDAGMVIPSDETVLNALSSIGFYRLRGYCYNLYDNHTKQFIPGTSFDHILKLYEFDTKLSELLFTFLSKIEIALRVRLTESLLIYKDALILGSPIPFQNKKVYWKNYSTICSEIARSHDVFIRHNFHMHNGQVPLWAAVEVLSFGTLSRIIKNLKNGNGSAFARLSEFYKYRTLKGNLAKPSHKTLSSWIQALVVLRNTCAHNARIYNRSYKIPPEILQIDKVIPQPPHSGLYELLLAMKYLRPSDTDWKDFSMSLQKLIQDYHSYISLSAMNFPNDWKSHL